MIIGISLFAVTPLFAETWHLTSSRTDSKAWSGDTAGQYWTNSKGEKGSGALKTDDTYYVINGKTLGASSVFGGGNLLIGDPDASDYSVNVLRLNANVGVRNGFFKFAAGYVWETGSRANIKLDGPTVVSPKERPFGFISAYHDHSIKFMTYPIKGEKGVGIVFGGYYDGQAIQYMNATNVTLNVENGLADYHGDIRVVSNKPLSSPTKGNVTFTVPPTDSDATLQIESGAEFNVASVGEVKLSGLTMHTESLLTIPYDSSSKTTGVIRVTDHFSIPEDEGKVGIHFATKPSVPENEWPYIYPILIVPSTQEMDAEKFALSDESVYVGDEKPLLRVFEDKENGVKSLVAIFPGRGKLIASDSNAYNIKTIDHDYSVYASAFTNANSWSNGNLPHEFAIYEFGYFGKNSGRGHIIRTPYDREGDYVFPGLALRAVRKAGEEADAIFVLADNTKTTINLELACPLSLRVVKNCNPTLAGTIRMEDDVTSSAWVGSLLTIDSVLFGTGNWTVSGMTGTGSPHSYISFTADNSEWKGTISLKQDINASGGVPGTGDAKHQKLLVTNPAGLGGRLDDFNYRALSLADCSEVIVTNSLELAKDLNRGIYIVDNAIVRVDAGGDFVCNWPITFNGRLYKTNAGTLSLGGAAQFLEVTHITNITEKADDSGNVTAVTNIVVDEQILVDGIQKDPSKRQLTVQNGAVKALAYDCINGVTVDFKANADTSLVLDFDPADDNLKRYGFYNVKTDTPFAAGGTINVRIDNPDADALIASKEYKLGLITVKTLAANALNLDSLIKFNKPEEFANLKVRMIREDDVETGFTTYSAYYDFVGFQVIVR